MTDMLGELLESEALNAFVAYAFILIGFEYIVKKNINSVWNAA